MGRLGMATPVDAVSVSVAKIKTLNEKFYESSY
jgi:hypothetical protein